MKNYVLIWILQIALLIGVGYIALFGYDALPKTSVAILCAGTAGALLLIANELKCHQIKELKWPLSSRQ